MSEDRPKIFGRGEEFLNMFSRGAEFTKELMQENEKLRKKIMLLEQQQSFAAADPDDWDALRKELLVQIESLEEEKRSVLERLTEVEEENRHFADRYVEIEEENNNLANLYVASFQLHSTLDMNEVVSIILEIVINLIGAEIFAIYAVDEKTGAIEPIASEGLETKRFPATRLGEGCIGEAVESGELYASDSGKPEDGDSPIVCIPLRVQDQPVGAIAIHRLLSQKDGFTPLDHELFTLLAGHAATALFSARLYSQSERKLNTIQGFIDLLTD